MTNLTKLIDDLGDLKAAMGKLEAQKKALEAALADLAPGAYESERYRLSISDYVSERPDEVLAADQKRVVEKYRATLSTQYLTAHTVKTPARRHLIGVPTGKGLAA